MRKETLIACLINLIGGGIMSYNANIVAGLSLPFVKCTLFEETDHINVPLYQGIFTALHLVFAAFGSQLSMYIYRKKGMKASLCTMGVIAAIMPILMVLYKNFWYITVMRGILGLSMGFTTALCCFYGNSIVAEDVKGRVGSIFQFSSTIFVLLAQMMNYFFVPEFSNDKCIPLSEFSWRIQLGLSTILGIAILVIMHFAPDVKYEKKKDPVLKVHTSIFAKENVQWVIFAIMLAFFNQLTGINGVLFYSAQVLSDAGINNVLLVQMFVIGIWNIISVVIFMIIVDRVARKSILMVSLGIMVAGTAALVTSFMNKGFSVVAIIGMLLYIFGFENGSGPLFYVMATQDFPKQLVDQGISLANIVLYIFCIALSLTFPMITEAFGAQYTFIMLGCFQVICMIYFGFRKGQTYSSVGIEANN